MSTQTIDRLIEQARQDYQMLLLDTGVVPGSVEAMLVASRVDAVIVVLDDSVKLADYKRMLSYLRVAGATIAGTVYNKATDPGGHAGPAHHPAYDATGDVAVDGSGILAASVLADFWYHQR
jgi:Mrp family chromosome partitioning ATPase